MTSSEPRGAMPAYGLFIDNAFTPAASGRTFEVENPATAATIATAAHGDAEDVARAVAAAERSVWGRMPGAERARILTRAADILAERMDDFVAAEVAQTGRPIREMKAQLARTPEWYAYFGALARTHEGRVHPFGGSYLNYSHRRPLGVVGALTPWNHPLLILTKKVAPALAAGNTMVVKPSEIAPLTPLMLGEVLAEAGLPAGAYNVVTGFGPDAGAAVVNHPSIAKIDLTGGTPTGRKVAAIAGERLIPMSAELGGKASVVVFADMVEAGTAGALFASFVAAGQTCVQGARLLIERSVYDEVVETLGRRARAIRVGDPTDPATEMGPLVSARQRETAERYVAIGREEGARVVAGGARPGGEAFARGYYYAPTVLADVASGARVAQEEIFGPVVCCLPFEDEADAIRLANDTPFGLAASVWSREVSRAHRVAHAIDAGIVWVNDHHRIDPSSPWGGFAASGIGKENGIACYESYTKVQSVVVNLSPEPFDWFEGEAEGKRYS
ncbi:aldehyde dehydrogenase family protein [Acuticoccus sediminis]|uniref:aldehyde dehydrogenase family protein n=1 Tax=Acuticoccus sediminis TaxID=2184697 RepID=UPI001CFF3102|nr:aldehyde dehydrogenase family protein [Acuticoccus sediminis]